VMALCVRTRCVIARAYWGRPAQNVLFPELAQLMYFSFLGGCLLLSFGFRQQWHRCLVRVVCKRPKRIVEKKGAPSVNMLAKVLRSSRHIRPKVDEDPPT